MATAWILCDCFPEPEINVKQFLFFRSGFIRLPLVVLAGFIFVLSTRAQQIKWSPLQKFSRDTRTFGYIASGEGAFLVMEENIKESTITFHEYDLDDLNIKVSNTFDFGSDSGRRFEYITSMKSQIMVFTSGFSEENEHYQIFCTTFDMHGKKLADTTLVHFVLSESKTEAPEFGVELSPDSTKMLLYFDPPLARRSSESISFKCYDQSLDLIWEKDMLLPYTSDVVQVHSFLLDNNANVYMMSGENPEKDNRRWQRPMGGRYVVFFYNAKDKKLKEYDVSLKDKQVISVGFALVDNQDVVICGYYSNDFKFSAAGTFLFTINASGGAVKTATFMPFSQEFVGKLIQKSREGEASLPDFYLDKIFIREDNSILVIGEQYYISEYIITDPTTGRQTIEYRFNFDDIVVTRIDPGGRHLWNAKIPKRQYTTSDTEHFSYQCFDDGKRTRFYFNDHADNEQKLSAMNEGEASLWSGGRQSVTTMIELTEEGKFTRKAIIKNKERDGALSPMVGNVDCNTPEVLGYKEGKEYRFVLVGHAR
jgi:hypothetical protein